MTRLDHHVLRVQNKLTVGTLLAALAWALLGYAALVWLVVLLGKFHVRVPKADVLFWVGLGASVAGAIGYAVWRRPSRHQAAVAIDEKLSLQEKFSTALYVRPSTDPFAAATVRDAEQTAERVNLHQKFPLAFPKPAIGTAAMALIVFLTAWLLPTFDLFGVKARTANASNQQRAEAQVKDAAKKALAEIAAAPPQVQAAEPVQQAKRDLEKLLNGRPVKEPTNARRIAEKAMQDITAIKDKIKEQKNYALTQDQMKVFKSMKGPVDESSPVGKAHSELQKGKFTEAIQALGATVQKFDKMDKAEQAKAAQQMNQLAQAIKQQAEDPKVQKQIQEQLKQLGANQKQAQQMQQAMQNAANGDKNAQQQLQQMANQVMQQMNNGQGPNQQQKQQIQQMMQQMQAQANNQQNAQAMAQAAQQMAQAMQQQAGQQQGQQQGQQPGAQQGQQANQQQNGQQMAQAQKQMQQALQQMQAQNQAAQAAAAQQGQGQQPGQQGAQANQAGQGNQPGAQWGNNPGQQNQPQNQQQQPGQGNNGGQGGFAQAAGGRPDGEQAPFGVTQEVAPSQTIEKGKILASSFVKAPSEKGKSEAELREVMEREYNESTDEVEQDRIPAQAQKAVKDYFDSVKEGGE